MSQFYIFACTSEAWKVKTGISKYPISTYNFKLADHKKMKEELDRTGLSGLIHPGMDRDEMENTLRSAIEEA